MTVQNYLLKFRKISPFGSLGEPYDHLNHILTDDQELISIYRTTDYRHAKLVSDGCLFDLGQVSESVQRYVQQRKQRPAIKILQ